jgi:hypothetical protein
VVALAAPVWGARIFGQTAKSKALRAEFPLWRLSATVVIFKG